MYIKKPNSPCHQQPLKTASFALNSFGKEQYSNLLAVRTKLFALDAVFGAVESVPD